jgi:hypothetical protein
MAISSFLLLLTLVPALVAAQEKAKDAEEKKLDIEVHGFLLGVFSGRTTGVRPPGGDGSDFVLGEERLRLELSVATASGEATLLAKGDLFHDAIADEVHLDIREAYAGYTIGAFDFRLGRQIMTWGVGDLFFINDVFPKDWESFYSGRPMEYLKLGVDGFRVRYSSDVINAEGVVVPFFTPDTLPSAQRFFFFDPFSGVPTQVTGKPRSSYSNTECAIRLYRQIGEADVSVYAYRGFWRDPSVRLDNPVTPTTATRFFPTLSVYGLSVQRALLEGVVSAEAGYYDSRQDHGGNDPTVPNSQGRFLCGYQRQFWEDFTAGLQFYAELMEDYPAYRAALPPGFPSDHRLRTVVSLRITQLLDYQAVRVSLFVAYSPSDVDYFVQPEVSYKLSDNLSVALGANVWGGRTQTTFFGQFDKSDNVFLNVRFDF